MSLLVQKYGGSSLKNADRIRSVADRVAAEARSRPLVVVVSAMGDTTDMLVDLARRLSRRPEQREIDMLLSTGEQVSASLLVMALHERGCPAISLAGWQAGIRTDSRFSTARITDVNVDRIRHELAQGRTVIVTGFQGVGGDTGWEEVTTLGRGGSDATAVALAASLDSCECEIYTDVSGIYTADPRIVPDARKLDFITHEEILELAQYGAQVMMPRSVELAQIWNVTVHVRSSYTPDAGTRIGGNMEYGHRVAGIAHQTGVAKVTFVGLADRPKVAQTIFEALTRWNVHADMIVQNIGHHGRTDLSVTVPEDDRESALAASEDVRALVDAQQVTVKGGMAKVSVVGAGLSSSMEYASTMFGCLGDLGINIDMISTSGIRITCVIEGGRAQEAVRELHAAFHLDTGGGAWQDSA
ncbi:MAG: aspartate kinase [Chloroflexota bacterium]|nr:MAG: aspartate kinase [Chloroflexota bacterium]